MNRFIEKKFLILLDYRNSIKGYKVLFRLFIAIQFFSPTFFYSTNLVAKENISIKKCKKIVSVYGQKYSSLKVPKLIILSECYKKLELFKKQVKILEFIDRKLPNKFRIHKAIADASKKIVYKAIFEGKKYESYASALDDMMTFYQSAIRLDPNNKSPYQGLMEVYTDQENIREGLALTHQMKKIFGETKDVVFYLCQWNSKYGLIDQTKASCEKAIKLNPKNHQIRIYNAKAYRDSGDLKAFRDEILKTYRKFPNNLEVIDIVGQIYIEDKNFNVVEEILSKRKNSSIERLRMNLTSAFYRNGKYKEALKYFSESCSKINLNRKKYIRSFESNIQSLEYNDEVGWALRFQKAISKCRNQPIRWAGVRKVNFTHFNRGVRLPANARDIEGRTLDEKRYNYDMNRKKALIEKERNIIIPPIPTSQLKAKGGK